MVFIFTYRFTDAEKLALTNLIESIYPYYKILDLSTDKELPTLDEIKESRGIVFCNNVTKGKSKFAETIELHYGKELLAQNINELRAVRIDRPNTFMESKETYEEAASQIRNLIFKEHKSIVHFIPKEKLQPELLKALGSAEAQKVFKLKTKNGQNIEIRPDIFPPSEDQSFTYSEFAIFLAISNLFEFENINIY